MHFVLLETLWARESERELLYGNNVTVSSDALKHHYNVAGTPVQLYYTNVHEPAGCCFFGIHRTTFQCV